jgi:hypothetical protein
MKKIGTFYERNKEKVRNQKLKYMYGISLEDYNKMFIEQNGCCKICQDHQSKFKNSLCVDHCHTTGKVRGLLCDQCNRGLGSFKDDIEIVKNIIKYLSC